MRKRAAVVKFDACHWSLTDRRPARDCRSAWCSFSVYFVYCLRRIRYCTGSQCSYESAGVAWSRDPLPITRRAATFCAAGVGQLYTVSQTKTMVNCFCQNFVKFPPILIINGRKMIKRLELCEVHSFSTSSNSRHRTTVLNANVPNCYTTLKVIICNKLSKDLVSTQ